MKTKTIHVAFGEDDEIILNYLASQSRPKTRVLKELALEAINARMKRETYSESSVSAIDFLMLQNRVAELEKAIASLQGTAQNTVPAPQPQILEKPQEDVKKEDNSPIIKEDKSKLVINEDTDEEVSADAMASISALLGM